MADAPIRTPEDLDREFRTLAQRLSDTKTDWNLRVKSLRRIQQIVNTNAATFENFQSAFLRLVPAIGVQLTDLRSAVVKEAAQTVSVAAATTQDAFEGCAERLCEVLFKSLNSGTRLIAETAHECMCEMLKHCQTWKLLPKYAEQLRSKNPNIRTKASEYVSFMLASYSQDVFERGEASKAGLLDMVESFLVNALGDASAEARAAAREGFRSYSGLYPERCDALYYRLEPATQKAIGEPNRPMSEIKRAPPKKVVKPKPTSGSTLRRTNEENKTSAVMLSDTGGGEYQKRPQRKSEPLEPLEPPTPDTPSDLPIDRHSLDAKKRPKRPESVKDVIETFAEKTYDEAWTTRCGAFDKLTSLWVDNSKSQEALGDAALWEAVLNTFFEHLSDPHLKVQIACLRSLKCLIETMPEQFSFTLERLLPELLKCLGEPKETVVAEAQTVLELILDLYMPEDLLNLMLKVNLEGTQKVKQRHLELICDLAEQVEEFFDSVVNCKAYLRKVVAAIKESSSVKPLVLIAMAALKPLRETHQELVNAFLLDLPGDELQLVRRVARELKDPLDAVLNSLLASKPTPQPKRATAPQSVSTTFLAQLSSNSSAKLDALKQLETLSADIDRNSSFWDKNIQDVIEGLLQVLKDDTLAVRESAFKVIKALSRNFADLVHYSNPLIDAVVQTLYSEDRQIIAAAEETLDHLFAIISPREVLVTLISMIDKEEVPALQAILRHIVKAVRHLDVDLLLSLMGGLMARMKQHINHVNADVRKSVVFVLVELHFVLATEFTRYLEELSPSQQKLVGIYVERRLNSR